MIEERSEAAESPPTDLAEPGRRRVAEAGRRKSEDDPPPIDREEPVAELFGTYEDSQSLEKMKSSCLSNSQFE